MRLHKSKAIIPDGFRMLGDDEKIQAGDSLMWSDRMKPFKLGDHKISHDDTFVREGFSVPFIGSTPSIIDSLVIRSWNGNVTWVFIRPTRTKPRKLPIGSPFSEPLRLP